MHAIATGIADVLLVAMETLLFHMNLGHCSVLLYGSFGARNLQESI